VADQPLLSIIVTSYTMERFNDVCGLIDSIKAQIYPDIEVVFVVERVPELGQKTAAYAREKGLTRLTVLFHNGEPGLSASRNAGIDKARGDIVAFVDDDVVLFPDWAAEMVKTYNDDSVIGVTGPALPLWQDRPLSWFPEEFYWIISCTGWYKPEKVTEVRNGWGHSMSLRKEAFTYCRFEDTFGRTKGFNTGGKKGPVGDDTEFCINLKVKSGKMIVYNPTVKVYHKVYSYRLTPGFIRNQAYWQGYTKAMFKKLYNKGTNENKILDTENQLLKRIFFKLFPNIAAEFFRHFTTAWKRLRLSVSVLFYLAVGYFSAAWPVFGKLTKKMYST
jgi:glucosyl-dolichyl phosphate glucuronosyltransferase